MWPPRRLWPGSQDVTEENKQKLFQVTGTGLWNCRRGNVKLQEFPHCTLLCVQQNKRQQKAALLPASPLETEGRSRKCPFSVTAGPPGACLLLSPALRSSRGLWAGGGRRFSECSRGAAALCRLLVGAEPACPHILPKHMQTRMQQASNSA